MKADAKALNIRSRHRLFVLHLLFWLIARVGVGTITQPMMPLTEFYVVLLVWGALVAAHWLFVSISDARDRASFPFRTLNPLIISRERRWLLLIINAMLWFISEAGVAGILIPHYYFARFEQFFSLLWMVQTAILLAHLGMVVYAEINDRAARKRKNTEKTRSVALREKDGELVDYPETQKVKAGYHDER